MTTSPLTLGSRLGVGRSRRADVDWLAVGSGSVCVLMLGIAVFGGLLAPYAADHADFLAVGQGPSFQHIFGTDSLGRDIFSRALVGARLSLAAPLLIVITSGIIGTYLGIAAAWIGGWFDRMLNRSLNVVFAVPGILVAVIAAAVFGAGFWAPVLAITLVYIPYVARVVRSAAVRECKQPYVEGLQLGGITAFSICSKHVLRNVSPLVLAQMTIGFGSALVDFAAVSFIGLGVQDPTPEWGVMVADGRSELLNGAIQQSLVAGLFIVVTVVAFNVLGDRLSDRFGASS